MNMINNVPEYIPREPLGKADAPETEGAKAEVFSRVKDTIEESKDDFQIYGKKLGTFATASLGTIAVPIGIALAVPALAGFLLTPAGILASMVSLALEEKYVGIGKHIGGMIGSALGSGVGLVKAGIDKLTGKEDVEGPRRVVVPKRAPQGKGPFEPLALSLLHKAEKAVTGKVPERTDGAEFGEKVGCFALSTSGAMIFPTVMSAVVGGPVGLILCSMVGSLIGLTLGNLEENTLGVGRAVGEAAGTAIDAVAKKIKNVTGNAGVNVKLPAEPLLKTGLHKVEEKVLGTVPEQTGAVKKLATAGQVLACFASAALLPIIAGPLLGGILGSTLGFAVGFALGAFEEKILGAGRTVGEIAGTAVKAVKNGIGKLRSGGKDTRPPAEDSAAAEAEKKASIKDKLISAPWKAFLKMSSIIAEPMMSFIIDLNKLASLALVEKPVQTMEFQDRPLPEVNRERVLNNFIAITGINGVSKDEDAVAGEIGRQLNEMKIQYTRDEAGNLFATIPATKGYEDSPTVLLSAHMDTVSPTSHDAIRNDGRRIRTNERQILGSDDRAGIAEILEGVQVVQEKGLPHPEIKIVLTIGEEVGLVGSTNIKPEAVATRPTLGYIMDSTDKRSIYMANDAVLITKNSLKYNYGQEDPLVQVAIRSLADAGIKPRPVHGPIMAGAATDANTPAFNTGNIHSIALGIGANEIHTPLENIKIQDLEECSKVVVGLLTCSCDLKVDEEGKIVPRFQLAENV